MIAQRLTTLFEFEGGGGDIMDITSDDVDVAQDITLLNATYGIFSYMPMNSAHPINSPLGVNKELTRITKCDRYRNKSDNLLANAIFYIGMLQNPNYSHVYDTQLKRCIVQMDSEPFQRLVGALSELGLREILMEIMRIRHDSTIEPETRFRL